MFASLIPIHLMTTRLAILKHSAKDTREARVKAQEEGSISFRRFSQGLTGWGYLMWSYVSKYFNSHHRIASPCKPIEWEVLHTR